MEKVIYFLGAGFSAPLGLPLMNDFLMKSKDMYFNDSNKYNHFDDVFKKINEMAISKNYYNTDLFNIEEILSIFEMDSILNKEEFKKIFLTYIKDVIEHYSPKLKSEKTEQKTWGNWEDSIFPGGKINNYYGFFIGNILNALISRSLSTGNPSHGGPIAKFGLRELSSDIKYSIITLNYDCIPEIFSKYLNDNYWSPSESDKQLNFYPHSDSDTQTFPSIAKLHGSVDSDNIVPPTWNKGVHGDIQLSWQHAYKLLIKANHIRFIGYSLPITDSYVKYLLKSAILKAPHLKSIDVICLDPAGDVKTRYDEFIHFYAYRFINADTLDYLIFNHDKHKKDNTDHKNKQTVKFDMLRDAHNEFMQRF